MIRRDSAVLWLAAAIAALYYLGDAGDPRLWGFEEWRKAGLAAALWGIGKLQSSPLKGSNGSN